MFGLHLWSSSDESKKENLGWILFFMCSYDWRIFCWRMSWINRKAPDERSIKFRRLKIPRGMKVKGRGAETSPTRYQPVERGCWTSVEKGENRRAPVLTRKMRETLQIFSKLCGLQRFSCGKFFCFLLNKFAWGSDHKFRSKRGEGVEISAPLVKG